MTDGHGLIRIFWTLHQQPFIYAKAAKLLPLLLKSGASCPRASSPVARAAAGGRIPADPPQAERVMFAGKTLTAERGNKIKVQARTHLGRLFDSISLDQAF